MRNPEKFQCQHCGSDNLSVVATRPSAERIYRRRKCLDCGNMFTTYEYSKEYFEKINGELGKYRLIGQIINELFHGGVNNA